MGQINDIFHDTESTETSNFFCRECAIFILPASQVESLSISKILFCICQVLSPSVEKCG